MPLAQPILTTISQFQLFCFRFPLQFSVSAFRFRFPFPPFPLALLDPQYDRPPLPVAVVVVVATKKSSKYWAGRSSASDGRYKRGLSQYRGRARVAHARGAIMVIPDIARRTQMRSPLTPSRWLYTWTLRMGGAGRSHMDPMGYGLVSRVCMVGLVSRISMGGQDL